MSNALSDFCQNLKTILGMGQPRVTLWIGISVGLTRTTGRLFLQDHKGRRLIDNIPLRTYGITPIARYNVMGIRVSGPGTPYPVEFYGPEGIVILEAQLGANNGYLTLQGGRVAPQNDLLATKGGFRVTDRDMQSIIIALETIEGPIDCYCVDLDSDDNSLFDQEETEYEESSTIEESWGDSEFQPEPMMDELLEDGPIDEWVETSMSDDGYI
jgi:hypothetical protein